MDFAKQSHNASAIKVLNTGLTKISKFKITRSPRPCDHIKNLADAKMPFSPGYLARSISQASTVGGT